MSNDETYAVETPELLSLKGYTLAKESGKIQEGIDLCNKAIRRNPNNCEHYLYLGRIYVLANNRPQAIKTFQAGLKYRRDYRIIEELNYLGNRKKPVFPSLPRGHVVNRLTGKILHSLKLR